MSGGSKRPARTLESVDDRILRQTVNERYELFLFIPANSLGMRVDIWLVLLVIYVVATSPSQTVALCTVTRFLSDDVPANQTTGGKRAHNQAATQS